MIECALFAFVWLEWVLFCRFVLLGCLNPIAIEQDSFQNSEQDRAGGDDNCEHGQQRIDRIRSGRNESSDQKHDEYHKRNDDQRIGEPEPDAISFHCFGSFLSR